MSFVNTIWLWGLAALLIPIGIHLLSRKQGKLIRFGSIRHLDETSTQQFRTIRLNEVALLLLRCLFVVFLVLMLAGLQFNTLRKKNKLMFIERGLENNSQYAELIDSMKSIGFEVRNLEHDVLTNNPAIRNKKADYWSHLQQLNPEDEIVVLSYGYAEGFKGKRIGLPQGVRWLSAEPDPTEYYLNAIEFSVDSAMVRRGISRPDKTSFRNATVAKRMLDSAVIESPDTVTVAVIFDTNYQYDKNILLAALEAIKTTAFTSLSVQQIHLGEYSSDPHDWIIWLADEKPPETKNNLILMDEGNTSAVKLFLPTPSAGNHSWLLTKRLNEEVALRENLTVQLAMILAPGKKYEDRASGFDRRLLPEKLRWGSLHEKNIELNEASDDETGLRYISIALLIILISERLLSFKKNQ